MEKNNSTYLLCGVLNNNGVAWDTAYVIKLFYRDLNPNAEPNVSEVMLIHELFEVEQISMQELTDLFTNNQIANLKKVADVSNFIIKELGSKEISIVFNLLEYTKFWAFTLFLDSYGRLQCLPNDLLGIMVKCGFYTVIGGVTAVLNSSPFESYKPYFKLTDRQTKIYKEYLRLTSKNAVIIADDCILGFLINMFRLMENTIAALASRLAIYDLDLIKQTASNLDCYMVEKLLVSTYSYDLFRGYLNCIMTDRVICHLSEEYGYGGIITAWLKNIQAYGDRIPLGNKHGSEILYYFASIACIGPVKSREHERITPIEIDRTNSLINFNGRVIRADVGYGGKLWQYSVPYLFPFLESSGHRSGNAKLKLAISTPGWGTILARNYELDIELFLGDRGSTSIRVAESNIMQDEQPKGEFNYALIKALELSRSGYSNVDLYDSNRTRADIKVEKVSCVTELINGVYDRAGFKNLLYNYGINESTKKDLAIASLSHICTRKDMLIEVRSVSESVSTSNSTDILHLSYFNKGKLVYTGFLNATFDKLNGVLSNLLHTSNAGIKEETNSGYFNSHRVYMENTCMTDYKIKYDAEANRSCAKYFFDQYAILEARQISRYITVGIIKVTGEIVTCYRLPGIYFENYGVACSEYRIDKEVVTDEDNLSVINEFTYVPVAVAETLDSAVALGQALAKLCSVSNLDEWFIGKYRYERAYLCLTAKTPSEKAENVVYYLQRRIIDDVHEPFSVTLLNKFELDEKVANQITIPWEE